LYSTHPETLRAAKRWCSERGRPFSLHLAEHPDETEQMLTGGGEFAEVLRKGGVLPAGWEPPGCRPVEYADRLGLLDAGTIAVHCVQLDEADVAILAARGVTVCLCPRSNEYIAVGRAPWRALRDAGVPLCLGTDGLSSNHDLNLWNEALEFLGKPDGPGFAEVLGWLTAVPARHLSPAGRYGTLEPGAQAGYSIVPDGAIRTAKAGGRGPFRLMKQ
jgi:cytosine/adenosine deaminase-related metal-dependent hydrolase